MIFAQMPRVSSRFFIVSFLSAVLLVEHREIGRKAHGASTKQQHDATDGCQNAPGVLHEVIHAIQIEQGDSDADGNHTEAHTDFLAGVALNACEENCEYQQDEHNDNGHNCQACFREALGNDHQAVKDATADETANESQDP